MGNQVPDRTGRRPADRPGTPGGPGRGGGRPGRPARLRLTLAAFLLVPLAELVVAILVGRAIGAGWTVLALLALTVAGTMTIKRAGLRSLGRLDDSVVSGRAPGPELADTGMLFVAGLLLFFPGFITGLLGLLLLVPPVRALARGRLERRLRTAAQNRVAFFSGFGVPFAVPGETFAGNPTVRGRGTDGVVITGEVLDDPAPRRPREPGDPTP